MSQILQSDHCKISEGPGEETELDVNIDFDGELDQQLENAILNATEPLTEEQLLEKISHKEILAPPLKEKRQIRVSFQSNELNKKFLQVLNSVPGRTQEAEKIFDFLRKSQNGTTTPICLFGNTGCGKTSMITKVMDFLQENSRTVKVAYLNCMSMWSTTHVYKGILSKLCDKKKFQKKEQKNIQTVLYDLLREGISNNEPTKIIILDQIDQFINDQSFLYNILGLLQLGSKLILVLISNVIDLTIKLDSKLQSRFKFQAIIFKPYTYQQIEKIIYYKYPDIRSFMQRDAVAFIAKKIANINSDIRLLEKIYSRMQNEYKQNGGQKLLNVQTVSGLIYEENKLPVMLAPYAAILKILHKATKKEQISHQIMHRLFIQGSRFPQSKEVLLMLCELQDCGLITLLSNRKNCDVTYYDYGIRIHQSLHLLYGDDGPK